MKITHFADLTLTHAWASIRAEARQTFIGYVWWLLNPLLFIGVYYLVFAVIMGSKTEDFIVFLMIGILSFQWFQNSLSEGSATIYNAGGLIKRVKLPKSIFPISKIIHNTWQFLFVFITYSLVIYIFMGEQFSLHLLAIPLIFSTQILVTTGLVLCLAALYPFFPDIKHVIQPLLRALLFLSGVFFNADRVPEGLQSYFYMNPMANLIEAYRDVMLRNIWPDFGSLFAVAATGLIFSLIGFFLINRFDSHFSKAIP